MPTLEAFWVYPEAPLATDKIINAFKDDSNLQERLVKSFRMMLTYYGLELTEENKVVRADDFKAKMAHWSISGWHNLLRMDRIINSLALLGQPKLARSFYECLRSVAEKEFKGDLQVRESLEHWTRSYLSFSLSSK
jgi:hypothetical protein